jgi:RNA polymerase sigma-70 factor (ECF subfamily)
VNASRLAMADTWVALRAEEGEAAAELAADAVSRAAAEARARFPGVRVSDADFLAWLAERCPDGEDATAALSRMHTADLYLACACANGEPAAIAVFERDVLPAARPAVARIDPSAIDDVLAELRVRLLVDGESGTARIRSYIGRGPLTSWVQVAAMRLAHSRGRQKKDVREDADRLAILPYAGDDPELARIRKELAEPFRRAFTESLSALDARDRNVIRLHLLEGVSTESIGRIYRVHRATVARWIAGVHETLLRDTRRRLSRELRIDKNDFESFMRLLASQLEVSIVSALD